MKTTFQGELKTHSVRTLASNDKEAKIVFTTLELDALSELNKVGAQQIVKVTVETE